VIKDVITHQIEEEEPTRKGKGDSHEDWQKRVRVDVAVNRNPVE